MRVDRLREPARLSRASVAAASVVALAVTAAACGPNDDAYVALQNVMKSHITTQDHRPVGSVACTPHVHGTMRGETVHLRCAVDFTDGTSYTADAAIHDQNSGGTHNRPDTYSWDSPPPPK
ncbi:hypothetical protein PUR71_05645 [Streptomyces sp. SP17BM10]|uniref:hypothetical protein n=1 Tax=Streptomyces sp. SP17BM10 TaxID=3002530 RepID=UPI002E797F27|nr:hypothetical protein [Streptomyces sp. SP17BM10]MEE1782406.1 hypothetical protein [Streptomyces sp. SP17BM10]